MVVLDQFYQIVELNTSKISPLWKLAHVLACIVSAVCAFLTAFTFGRVLDNFDYNCILNAQIVFDNSTRLNTSTYSRSARAIDLTATNWGTTSSCNFAQFIPLVVMISALIWGMYFGMMSKGGAGYATDVLSRPWSILYPFIFFTGIFLIVYVISTQALKTGIKEFCLQFHSEFNNSGCVPQIEMYTTQFREYTNVLFYQFYPNMQVALISSEVGIWSWVFQLILSVVRICCVADFDLQLVTVEKKEDEEVENIVEFQEADELEEDSNI